ncbi:hypothetical protein R69919_01981 [Paraburkholderia gardini]|nr:hypothetical protein R69919_01981 [Paraburkholderia gardini]
MPCSSLLRIGRSCVIAWVAALAACSTVPLMPAAGPVTTTIVVARRAWHTDVCVRSEDAGPWVSALAQGFEGARFLCFGFGERQYVVTREHGVLAALSALLPSQAAVLMTVLRAPPGAAFGSPSVIVLGVSDAGLAGLRTFLQHSVQTDAAGGPVRLGDGPYPGSVFFAARGTYDALYTCNTWTSDALRSAGLPVRGAILFARDVMDDARQLTPESAAPLPTCRTLHH